MYSEASILTLENRIGFGKPTGLPDGIAVDMEHQTGTSGRLFSYFHKLVSLENLYATVGKIEMGSEDFNNYLSQLKTDAVKAVLVSILDINPKYRNDEDYSGTLMEKPELFDNAIGYSLAISAIEQMISTSRLNLEERNANMAYERLKIELEGMVDNDGNILAKGIERKLYTAKKKAIKVIFPNPLVVEALNNYW